MTVKKEKYHTMIFFSLIAPKVRHVQTIDKKYTHSQYNQILFLNEGFCTLFAWKEQMGYAIQLLNKSSCLSSFQIAQLSAVKCLKKYMVMHVPGNNIPFWNAISFELEPHTILPDEGLLKRAVKNVDLHSPYIMAQFQICKRALSHECLPIGHNKYIYI